MRRKKNNFMNLRRFELLQVPHQETILPIKLKVLNIEPPAKAGGTVK
jgi:hypothetical protein